VAIEAVLFDYSGVLTTSLDVPSGDMPFDLDAVVGEFIVALSSSEPHPWHELERGEMSLGEFCSYVESRVEGASALFAVESELNVMANLQLLDERIELVRELKASGYRVGLVTNNVAEWQPLWRPGIPTGLFEMVMDSADVGCRKPEPEIYQRALDAMNIARPATALFVDDFEWNVAGAEAVGMTGLHCASGSDLRASVMAAIEAAA